AGLRPAPPGSGAARGGGERRQAGRRAHRPPQGRTAMRRGERGPVPDGRGSALADRVEGYLLARTHHEQARREAEALCARLPWLTTAQAEDVTRQYVRQRIDLTRTMMLHTLERAEQMRGEYEARYA